MKKIQKKIITIMLAIMFLITAIPPTYTKATIIPKLNKNSITLCKGKMYTLKVINSKKPVKWSTSKKAIATVSNKGKVSAKATGTAYITAKIESKKLKCKVVVKNHNWKTQTKTVHHKEKGHYEKKVTGYKQVTYTEQGCGTICYTQEEFDKHEEDCGCGGDVVYTRVPIKEKIWVVDKKAYNEKVTTKTCSRCKDTE